MSRSKFLKGVTRSVKRPSRLAKRILDSVLPHHCPLCHNQCIHYVCEACLDALPLIHHPCRLCALPLKHSTGICAECLSSAPAFQKATCLYEYKGMLPTIFSRLKDRGDIAIAKPLAHQFIHHCCQTPPLEERIDVNTLHTIDMLVPVPTHWKRKLKRGFNQSELISRQLSATLAIPTINAVKKRRISETQKTLSKKQRIQNLNNSFDVIGDIVNNKHIVIIDDIITTGATVNAIAKQCYIAGASRVDVWAIARTPKSG